MDLRQLKSYVAVVKYGNFTKAAQKLGISQPTISIHLKALEDELGVTLLARTTKSIVVTPKGWELFECAKKMLELRENLLRRWNDEEVKLLQIGASTIPSTYILPEVLPEYGKNNPDVNIVIQQGDSKDIIEDVKKGKYDIGLVGMEEDSNELNFEAFCSDSMVVITPYNDYFLNLYNQGQSLPKDVLLHQSIITREDGSGSQKAADKVLEALGIDGDNMHVVARVNDQESIKNLVASGLGIAVISERAAKNFADDKKVLIFKAPDKDSLRKLYLVCRKDTVLNGNIAEFAKVIKAHRW